MKLDPLKDWYADVSNLQQLEAVLKNQAFRKAIEVLEFVARPRPDFTERSSADAITHQAMEHKRCEGFFSFVEHLYTLSEPLPVTAEKLQPYADDYVQAYARRKGMLAAEEEKTAE